MSQLTHEQVIHRALTATSLLTTSFLILNQLPFTLLYLLFNNHIDLAQAVMESVLRDYVPVECFIDDIGIFSSFSDHMKAVKDILGEMNNANFSIKPKKCFWAVKEVEYLGHIITCDGIKTQPKKIDAILHLQAPSTPKQLSSFIGMVNYYRDFIRRRSHLLAPLTAQIKNKK